MVHVVSRTRFDLARVQLPGLHRDRDVRVIPRGHEKRLASGGGEGVPEWSEDQEEEEEDDAEDSGGNQVQEAPLARAPLRRRQVQVAHS